MRKITFILYIILFSLVFAGFIFRLKGISDNHSFWADESYIAGLARDTVTSKRTLLQTVALLNYQPLYIITIASSLNIFGMNEFAARLPSIIFGTLGIFAAYLLAKKFSDIYGGLLAAFLFSFSQLNLANHTQAKPAAAIQAILIFNLYLISLQKKGKNNLYFHILIIFSSIVSTLMHFLGILVWIPYLIYLLYSMNWRSPEITRKKIFFVSILIITFLFALFSSAGVSRIKELMHANYNNLTYLRELIWRNYAFIFLPAIFGLFLSFRKNHNLTVGVFVFSFVLLYLWTFNAFHNVRYLVPFFGLIFVYFAIFWSRVGDIMLQKKSWLSCSLVAILLFAGGYKFVRKPANYYSPNADIYGDVQVADYKKAYSLIIKEFPDLSHRAVFNDVWDSQYWYLPEKQADAYFTVRTKKPFPSHVDGKMIYGTLPDFLKEKNKYEKGLLIVEEWDSLLPQEIRDYAKKNLKLEIRVEGLPQAKEDTWPIAVYSW